MTTKMIRYAWAIELGYIIPIRRCFAGVWLFTSQDAQPCRGGVTVAMFKTRALARAALKKMHYREKCRVVKVEVTIKAVS